MHLIFKKCFLWSSGFSNWGKSLSMIKKIFIHGSKCSHFIKFFVYNVKVWNIYGTQFTKRIMWHLKKPFSDRVRVFRCWTFIDWVRYMPLFKEKFEDTKGVSKSRQSKNRQYNGLKKKDKRTNNGLQDFTQKTKDPATWTTLKIGDDLSCSGRVRSSCSTCGIHRVAFVINFYNIYVCNTPDSIMTLIVLTYSMDNKFPTFSIWQYKYIPMYTSQFLNQL